MMLVTCFGYTGYRNAKFRRIQVHERITGISRELFV
jgi:DNA polymerase, archaea type